MYIITPEIRTPHSLIQTLSSGSELERFHCNMYTCEYTLYVYIHVPDVEIFEDLWIEVVNLSCHIQYIANTEDKGERCNTTSLHMYINYIHTCTCNSILLLSPFLRLSLLSLFPFLFLMLVCYTHIFHVHVLYNHVYM